MAAVPHNLRLIINGFTKTKTFQESALCTSVTVLEKGGGKEVKRDWCRNCSSDTELILTYVDVAQRKCNYKWINKY